MLEETLSVFKKFEYIIHDAQLEKKHFHGDLMITISPSGPPPEQKYPELWNF